jgi:hypothetical protein
VGNNGDAREHTARWLVQAKVYTTSGMHARKKKNGGERGDGEEAMQRRRSSSFLGGDGPLERR